MSYFLFILIALSAFAKDDEAQKLVEASRARKETWKVFREKVSLGDLCQPGDYKCFVSAASRVPGIHPEDLIASRSFLEPFYLRSIKGDIIPCGETCQQNNRAANITLFLQLFLSYNTGQEKIYSFKDSTTVRATRVRAYMDLSALGNMKKHMEYVKSEYAKLDLKKVTKTQLQKKSDYDDAIALIDSGKLFSKSILCHLHPGSLVYDEIASGKTKVEEKYKEWLKEFEATARKSCVDQTPIDYRGMDESTREYYDNQTVMKLKAIDCGKGDYACLRGHFRKIQIHYAKDIERVAQYLAKFMNQDLTPGCDETCRMQVQLRAAQTFITFISQYDRQKLGSTMDWKKFPEERYKTITEDVMIYFYIVENFKDVLESLAKLDSAKIKDEGLRSELKSIGKDVSDFVSGKMLRDSVICTMEPWTAAYDRYMTPYKKAKRNKVFEQDFIKFKTNVCK